MKVLIADKFDASSVELLRACGCQVEHDAALQGDALCEAIAKTNCRVLIVRGTRVSAEMLEAAAALSVVVRAGAGMNSIDVAAASRRSILVANCPGKNAVAVAELTFGLILALDRRIVENVTDLRGGVWNKSDYTKARGLKSRTLGIVGMGQIGQAVAARALAFEMDVVAWSRSLTEDAAKTAGIQRCQSPGEVASRCDVLTVHLAATPETKGIISAEVLGQLKQGAFVINTARADVMDFDALAALTVERGIRVGLDVYPSEPAGGKGEFADKIVKAGGVVYGTHHIGASTEQAQSAIAAETIAIVKNYLRTGTVRNCVNLCAKTPATYLIVVRHRNRPGVLAHTLNAISLAGVNVGEMENIICEGAESACAQIRLDGPLDADVLRNIERGNENIFAVTQARIGA